MSGSYTSSSSFYSSSSGANGEQVSGQRAMQTSYTDHSGNTTTNQATQNLGEPIVAEELRFDASGRPLMSGTDGPASDRRIEDVSDEQKERDAEYERRIEEEYAKREGGA